MDKIHNSINNRHKQNNICKKYRQYKPRIRLNKSSKFICNKYRQNTTNSNTYNKEQKAKSVDIVITATDKNGIKSIANVTTTGITKTDTNTYTVTKNQDYEFKVTDNAGNETNYTVTVTGITKVTLDAETIAKNPEAYYGKKVNNYTAGGKKTYRIFYIDTEGKFGDKNTVYLKADWTANDTTLSSYTSYTPSGTDLATYKKLNPSWAAQRGSSTSSWNDNEHAAAWLCSPSNWTTYCDTSKSKLCNRITNSRDVCSII